MSVFVLSFTNSTGLYIYRSRDGLKWKVCHPVFASPADTISTFLYTASSGSSSPVFAALGSNGIVLESNEDATTWTSLSGNFWQQIQWVIYSNSNETGPSWIGPSTSTFTYNEEAYVHMYAFDGKNWKMIDSDVNTSALVLGFSQVPISYKNSWVAFDSRYVYSSQDFLNWEISLDSFYYNLRSLTSLHVLEGSNQLLVSGHGPDSDDLFMSVDAVNWKRIMTNISYPYGYEPFGLLVAVEDSMITVWSDWLFMSQDEGINWVNTSILVSLAGNDFWLQTDDYVLFVGANFTSAKKDNLEEWSSVRTFPFAPGSQYGATSDTFYITDFSSGNVSYSQNGIDWSFSYAPYYAEGVSFVGFSEDQIFGVGPNGLTFSSVSL
jgi:hypothetical protein